MRNFIVLMGMMATVFLRAQNEDYLKNIKSIDNFGYNVTRTQLTEIAKINPNCVIPALLKELSIISVPIIYEDPSEKSDLPDFTTPIINDKGIHIIRCYQALEIISGIKMTAPSEHDFNVSVSNDPDLEDRMTLIIMSNKKGIKIYKTYYYWDTHLKFLIPPIEAQSKIIKKWNEWWLHSKLNKHSSMISGVSR